MSELSEYANKIAHKHPELREDITHIFKNAENESEGIKEIDDLIDQTKKETEYEVLISFPIIIKSTEYADWDEIEEEVKKEIKGILEKDNITNQILNNYEVSDITEI